MSPREASNRLECPSCGAPLRWKGVAPVVACRYCDTHVHTPTGQITHEPAVVRSQGKGSGGCAIVAVVVGINLLIGLIVAISTAVSEGPGKVTGVSWERLATLDLAGDNATVAAALGLAPNEDGDDLNVPLRGSDFGYAYLRWDDDHPEHIASFGLYASEGLPDPGPVIAALEASLGRRLEPERDGYRYWRWADAHLNVSLDGSHIGFGSSPDEDPHWGYRTKLMWSVVLAAAAGQALDVKPETRTAWLAHGYDLDALATMDLGHDVDSARAYVPSAFPGAHEEVFIGLEFEIPVAHPWFGVAELDWPNERGATLSVALLRPPPGVDDFPDQVAIRRCLDAALGAGEVQEQDHLAGTWSASWDLPDGSWVSLSPSLLQVRRDGHRAQPRAASWRRVFNTLHSCDPG